MGLLNPLETRISLEMSGDTKLYMLSAKQGDKATRYVVAELSNNGDRYFIPPGAYAVVNMKKPDGKTVYNDCVYSDSEVMFELTNQMLAAAGTAYCDIEIRTKDEAEIIKTQTFEIEIEKTMHNDSAILSSDEYTFFEKSMLKVKEITESLDNAKIDYIKAEQRENISTEDTFSVILGKLEKIVSDIKEVAYSGEYKDLTGAPKDLGDLTNNEGYVTTDTWKANTAISEGYVAATGGKANQIYGTDAEGNPGWQDGVEIDEMTGATEEAEGAAGIVPAPEAGMQSASLRGDGTWKDIEEMTGATEEAAGAAGIVPAPEAGMQDAFLRGNATWGNLGAGAFAENANNLATTQEGFFLDARQGKELADQISLLNSAWEIETISDFAERDTLHSGLSSANLEIFKSGKVICLYGTVTFTTESKTQKYISAFKVKDKYKPRTTYAITGLRSNTAPYLEIGSLWIAKNSREFLLYPNVYD